MSNKIQPSNQIESGSQLDLAKIQLPVTHVLRIVAQLVSKIEQLHESGNLHRSISVETVSVGSETFDVSLQPPTEKTTPFGGRGVDFECCPPELQQSTLLQVSADLANARQVMDRAGISFDPVRIDIYQLGALICRLLTGESVESYLQSPQTTNSIPPDLRRLIDRALGYQPEERINVLKDLQSDISDLMPNYPVADSAKDTKTSLGKAARESDTNSETNRPQGSSSGDDLPFDRLGHYEIVGRIGHGGMGDVYQGYEKDLDRTVAIKVLPAELARSDEFVKRFYAEATAAAKLSHANIIEIYFIGKDQGHHFFAMQYVEGESLSDLLHQRERLEVQETVAIISQALSGLDAAHKQGLVHRDIKPGNLLIDKENKRILLADFGLVKSIQNHTQMTATGMIMGTVDYISPEQGRGQEVDGRADLYAIGVMMYQMLSGRLPFAANSPTAMIFQHVYESPTPLAQIVPNVPRSLISIVDKLMAKSPDDRYQDAGDVLADLRGSVDKDQEPSHQRSRIIEAPNFDELTLPSSEWTDTAEGSDWWSRTRERMLDLFRAKAPEFLLQLQNTQHQVDGAVAEYERRCDRIQQLGDEAEEVQAMLQTQADSYQQLVIDTQARIDSAEDPEATELLIEEKIKHQRTADEIEGQIQEQQQQLDEIHSRLSEAKTKLVNLRSQRDILSARLKVAQAKSQQSGGRTVNKRKRMLIYGTAGIAVFASLIAVVVLYKNWNKSDNDTNRNQVADTGEMQTITNSIGMKFNLVPQGTFMMGSPNTESQRESDEKQHEVKISRPFYMGVHEVTQKQFEQVVGRNPSAFSKGRNSQGKVANMDTSNFPVENVSWNDAVEFLRKLNVMEMAYGRIYRLPTEAEWEYACRAGTNTPFHFGDSLVGDKANCDGNNGYGSQSRGTNLSRTAQVGSYQPNAFGLYDMHGNVWEWCRDYYAEDYYQSSPRVDPRGASSSKSRVVRGGSWFDGAAMCRAANRYGVVTGRKINTVGFRVVCTDLSDRPLTGPNVEIVKAMFGSGRGGISCENEVRLAVGHRTKITLITTSGLGIKDPSGKFRRELRISYRVDGQSGQLILKNSQRINICQAIIDDAARKLSGSDPPPQVVKVQTFTMTGKSDWEDSGISIEKGQKLGIWAPNNQIKHQVKSNFHGKKTSQGSLLARIEGRVIDIGVDSDFLSPGSGKIFFRSNLKDSPNHKSHIMVVTGQKMAVQQMMMEERLGDTVWQLDNLQIALNKDGTTGLYLKGGRWETVSQTSIELFDKEDDYRITFLFFNGDYRSGKAAWVGGPMAEPKRIK